MQNAFKLLYNNLWVAKSELPDYLREIQALPKESIESNSAKVDSSLREDETVISIDDIAASKLKSVPDMSPAIEIPISQAAIVNTPKTNKDLITSWDKLTDLINNCTDCRLCNTRKNLVIERGNRDAQWMFIGEAPGENEDIQGQPFVGSAGQLLDKMLLAMKLDREQEVYICNAVKCRPPQNRNPEIDEIAQCNNYLLSQINLIKPKIIVTLGRIAAHTLLKTTAATSKLRNQVHYITGGIPVIVTYHPAYLLRNPAAKKDTWADLQLAMKTFTTL